MSKPRAARRLAALWVHLMVPAAQLTVETEFLSVPTKPGHQSGFGDLEIALKWRFVGRDESTRQVAVYAGVVLPTADEARGLGTGHAQVELPVLVQVARGRVVYYAEVRRGFVAGPALQDNWFVGLATKHQAGGRWILAGELFWQSPVEAGAPHPENGKRLIDYLLSKEVESKLAFAECRQMPLRAGVNRPQGLLDYTQIKALPVDYEHLDRYVVPMAEFLRDLFRL